MRERQLSAVEKIQALMGAGYLTPQQERALLEYAEGLDHPGPKQERLADMHGSRQVCPECRSVGPIIITCNHANKIWVGPKWRAPKKTNDRAWKRIAQGEILWDREAIERKERREAERITLEILPNSRANRARRKKMMEEWHANRTMHGR